MNLSTIAGSLRKINVRDRKVQTGLIILIGGLGGAFGFYQYFYRPLDTQVKDFQHQVSDKESKLRTILAMKPELERIRAEIVAKGVLLDSLKSIFPDTKEVPKLLHDITRLAEASSMHTMKFNPMPDMQQEYYVENRYQLGMCGGYHDFGTFLGRLANLRLIINLSEVKLSTHPGLLSALQATDDAEIPGNTIEISFTLTTFSSRK